MLLHLYWLSELSKQFQFDVAAIDWSDWFLVLFLLSVATSIASLMCVPPGQSSGLSINKRGSYDFFFFVQALRLFPPMSRTWDQHSHYYLKFKRLSSSVIPFVSSFSMPEFRFKLCCKVDDDPGPRSNAFLRTFCRRRYSRNSVSNAADCWKVPRSWITAQRLVLFRYFLCQYNKRNKSWPE